MLSTSKVLRSSLHLDKSVLGEASAHTSLFYKMFSFLALCAKLLLNYHLVFIYIVLWLLLLSVYFLLLEHKSFEYKIVCFVSQQIARDIGKSRS